MINLTVLDLLRLAKEVGLIERWRCEGPNGDHVTFGVGSCMATIPCAEVSRVQRAIRILSDDHIPPEVKAGAEYQFFLRLASYDGLGDAQAEVDLGYVRASWGRAVDAGWELAEMDRPSTQDERRALANRLGLNKRLGHGTMSPLHTLKVFEAMRRAHKDCNFGFWASGIQVCLVVPAFNYKKIAVPSEMALFYLAKCIAGSKSPASEATLDCVSELADLCPWWHLV